MDHSSQPASRRHRSSDAARIPQLKAELLAQLYDVAKRIGRLQLWYRLGLVWLLSATIGAIAWYHAARAGSTMWLVTMVSLLAAGMAFLTALASWLKPPSAADVAMKIERNWPELNSALLAALQIRPELPDGRYGFLQGSVIVQAASHSALRNWRVIISSGQMLRAFLAQLAALGLFLFVLHGISAATPSVTESASTTSTDPSRTAVGSFAFTVEPGEVEIEKGTSLLVLARVTGAIPAEGVLVFESAAIRNEQPNGTPPGSNENATSTSTDRPGSNGDESPETQTTSQRQLSMSRSLNDPVFGARIPSISAALTYKVELGGQVSPTYRVTVFEYPRLERADATLRFPEYTGMEERRVQDVRTISVVEGTHVTLHCRLNKAVASARLEANDAPALDLAVNENELTVRSVSLIATKTVRYQLQLVDDAGRKNTQTSEIRIQVVPNLPPTVKPTFPARDVEASPLEEIDVRATVWDDFGIPRAGVTYSLAGHTPTETVLSEKIAGKDRKEIADTIRLEPLNAKPDELVAYYFWAEDFVSDGQVRRTLGDMYFAEVRHFEEIFRQGEAPPRGQQQGQRQQQGQGGNQNSQQAQQLGELQKEIINATWKVIRREVADNLTKSFVDDVKQIADSQEQALDQASRMGEQLTDAESKEYLNAVLRAMQTAVEELTTAHESQAREVLPQALSAEQSAYQALLKLRAREHQIVRQQQQQQQQGSPSSAGRSQQQRQQMEQLELSNEENRYETQRLAQSQEESSEQRESRQVLSRLKELARRQHDLNEQLKDLQAALEEAKDAAQKEEIRRQLQRLQEEQEQILRDTDELKSRMESPENQERMAEERQQLEQAREQVQKANEALQKDQATQAAAAGSRAEQSFDELREEFRKKSAGEFREEVKNLVEQARELERKEQEVKQRIAQAINPDAENRTLRTDLGREKIVEELGQQRERLSRTLDDIQKTIQEAETSEPLLAEKLYDATREVQSQDVSKALEATRQSIAQGLLEDAQKVEEQASKGIQGFREKVEYAAESVLGDETESLRRARDELRNLTRDVRNELRQNAPPGESERDPLDRDAAPAETGIGRSTRESETDERTDSGNGRQRARREEGNTSGREEQNGEADRTSQRGDPDNENRGQRPGRGQGEPNSPSDERDQNQQPGENGSSRQPGEDQESSEENPTDQPRGERPAGRPQENQPGQQPGQSPGQQPGQQPGDQQDPQAGEQRGAQPGGQSGQPANQRTNERGQQQSGTQREGERNQQQQQPGDRRSGNAGRARDLLDELSENGGAPSRDANPDFDAGGFAPFTGRNFREWSDRLRDVEEMVTDPELRAEAARIRDRARVIRADIKRRSENPNWDLVRMQVAEPLAELTKRVDNELLKRTSKQNLVPLDRDPVPPRFQEKTRRYYEQLGGRR